MRRDYWADRLLTDDVETWDWSLMVADSHGVYSEEWPCGNRPSAGERVLPPSATLTATQTILSSANQYIVKVT